ncbi:ion transporter [Evansella cellulosilytica]|uniref:Ion transport protein n=1 Tax=Evansella cellulosilytica (strain ATCC 21833 / DSM 2522 / FERM P-1141 / JCM 9156 / N-4) TaxID=649639 RepID=E6TXV0_EVAC2|nr:ion transporter [Evansella cellulosilytica]ADU30026.1 Ion transport protein [Evansella cellulosilytica DSM 2522]
MTAEKNLPSWKKTVQHIVDHKYFSRVIIGLILFNAIIVGLETYPTIYENYKQLFFQIDMTLLWIFSIEIILRIIAAPSLKHFFKGGWNWFDVLIVSAGHIFAGAHFITVLRILRVLRVFRAVSVIPSLRKLVDALLMTIPALGNIMLLMSIIFYIFAVTGTMLFREVAPEYFGSIQLSLLTLFQVVTLESWASEVMRPILHILPWSWIYFVLFVLVGTFVVFNLFIGVIVNNVEKADNVDKEVENTHKEVTELRKEVRELKELLQQQINNNIK